MKTIKNVESNQLPHAWRTAVQKILSQQGIEKTKTEITRIFRGYKKSDPHTKQVLEAILKLKTKYQREKTEENQMKEEINS